MSCRTKGSFYWYGASLVAQMVRNLSIMQKTWVRSLGLEDSLGKGMAPRPTPVDCPLPREFYGQRSLAGYSPWGCRVRQHWMTNFFFFFYWYKRFSKGKRYERGWISYFISAELPSPLCSFRGAGFTPLIPVRLLVGPRCIFMPTWSLHITGMPFPGSSTLCTFSSCRTLQAF